MVAAAVVAAATVIVVLRTGSDDQSALRAELEAEFAGAYPASPTADGQVVEIELVAATAVHEIEDGSPLDVWAYNGTVPGPTLRATVGDTLRVTVRNDLPHPTTVHWHGVRVPNDMDGVPGLNQPAIEPGAEFTYEFTPPDAGTFWYHSHVDGSEQIERGLHGAIVIEERAPLEYAIDEAWVLDDWLLSDDGQIDPDFDKASEVSHNGRLGGTVTVNGRTDTVLTGAPGDRVRLRVVNASNARVYELDTGALAADVVAVDGLAVGAHPSLSEVPLAPGNRIDLDLELPDDAGVHVITDVASGQPVPLAMIDVSPSASGAGATGAFAPPVSPSFPNWERAQEAAVDHELVFETHTEGDEWVWTINGDRFGDHEPIDLPVGRFTKIRLVNETHPRHPIHLHGQFFTVLSRNGAPADEPHFRDTVLLEMLDEVEIGLVPLDEGSWLLHCHIQEHAGAGMATVVDVG